MHPSRPSARFAAWSNYLFLAAILALSFWAGLKPALSGVLSAPPLTTNSYSFATVFDAKVPIYWVTDYNAQNCTSTGVGSYTVTESPQYGDATQGIVDMQVPGYCVGTSFPSAVAYYDFDKCGDNCNATSDKFQLQYTDPNGYDYYFNETALLAPTTTSWYVMSGKDSAGQTLDEWMLDEGQNEAVAVASGATGVGGIILSFGDPRKLSGGFGATGYHPKHPLSVSKIEQAVLKFAQGYFTESRGKTSVKILVGTTNNFPASFDESDIQNHAAAWAGMINWLNEQIISHGYSEIFVAAGFDAEMDWSLASDALSWAGSFSDTLGAYYVDFGDDIGCPAKCNNGWSALDVLGITSGTSAAYGVAPEIYTPSRAKWWTDEAVYGYNYNGVEINFLGPLTDHGACVTKSPKCNPDEFYTAPKGWQAFWNANDASGLLTFGPGTGNYSSDIDWHLAGQEPAELGIGDPLDPELLGKTFGISHNSWTGNVDGKIICVAGSYYNNDPAQGVVFVMQDGIVSSGIAYNAPSATGPLDIISANGDVLTLESKAGHYYRENADGKDVGRVQTQGGTIYKFDVRTRQFR